MIRPRSLHHLAVQVSNIEDAERFYVHVLGLPVLRRWTRDDGRERSLWLDLGGDQFLAVEAVEPGTVRDETSPGWHCVALAIDVSERDTWVRRLAEAGHPVIRETDFTIYVRDPEGALVGLSHYPTTKR